MSLTSSKPLAIVSGVPTVLTTGDTLTFNNNVTHASGSTVAFGGATVTGLVVTVAAVTDATGTFGFSGAAGVFSSTGISDLSLTGSGTTTFGSTSTGTLSVRSGTGSATLGDGTGAFVFGGTGGLTTSGVTTMALAGGSGSAVSYSATGTGTLGLRTATGALTIGDSTGTAVFSGTGGLSTNALTTVDLDASAAIQINSSAGKIQIGNDAVVQDLDLGTGGARNINLGSATAKIKINANQYVAAGSNSATISRQIGEVAGATLAVGDVVAYTATTGKIQLADANGSGAQLNPIGTCGLAAAADGSPTSVTYLDLVPVHMDSAPTAADIGKIVYLSETAGVGTLTPPSTTGSSVIRLGTLRSANSSDTICRVLWNCGLEYVA
jgi:hypothetical protein